MRCERGDVEKENGMGRRRGSKSGLEIVLTHEGMRRGQRAVIIKEGKREKWLRYLRTS